MSEMISTELRTSGSTVRVPCVVCGDRYRPYYAYVVVKHHSDDDTWDIGDICPRCLEAGKEDAIAMLKKRASFYSELADYFETIDEGNLVKPEEIEKAGKEVEAEILAEMRAEPDDYMVVPEKVKDGELPF